MKMTPEVIAALQVLKDAAENELDSLIVERCERDLIAPPKAEIIDENCQSFLGLRCRKCRTGHFMNSSGIHRIIWAYYHGFIEQSQDVHHKNEDKSDNDISNLKSLTKAEHKREHLPKKNFEKICVQCGCKFLGVYNAKFCSDKCRRTFENAKRTRVIKICKNCGRAFDCRKDDLDCVFCSRECHYEFRNKISSLNRVCGWCGKKFKAKRKSQKFCCNSCSASAREFNKKI